MDDLPASEYLSLFRNKLDQESYEKIKSVVSFAASLSTLGKNSEGNIACVLYSQSLAGQSDISTPLPEFPSRSLFALSNILYSFPGISLERVIETLYPYEIMCIKHNSKFRTVVQNHLRKTLNEPGARGFLTGSYSIEGM